AIPINRAESMLPSLEKGIAIEHPWLGISGQTLTATTAGQLGLSEKSGVLVVEVVPNGPSAKAGLQADGQPSANDDVITAIDGHPITATRAWLAGLGLVAVLLVGLIARDTVLAKPAAATIRTASADRGTVTSVVSGTGSLVPAGRMNVNFKVAGTLSKVDIRVGDTVKTGQVLARLDPTTQQAALSQAQASLASAQANLKATQTPLTAAQVTQLQHQVSAAQQNYNDTLASVNATNQPDAPTVAND